MLSATYQAASATEEAGEGRPEAVAHHEEPVEVVEAVLRGGADQEQKGGLRLLW